MINMDNMRASFAYKKIDSLCNEYEKSKNDSTYYKYLDGYRSRVLSAGVLIHQSGLLQALTFYYSKRKAKTEDPYHRIFCDILEWLGTHCNSTNFIFSKINGDKREENIFFKLVKRDEIKEADLQALTQEAIAILEWLKRFTEGMIKPLLKRDEEEHNKVAEGGA